MDEKQKLFGEDTDCLRIINLPKLKWCFQLKWTTKYNANSMITSTYLPHSNTFNFSMPRISQSKRNMIAVLSMSRFNCNKLNGRFWTRGICGRQLLSFSLLVKILLDRTELSIYKIWVGVHIKENMWTHMSTHLFSVFLFPINVVYILSSNRNLSKNIKNNEYL